MEPSRRRYLKPWSYGSGSNHHSRKSIPGLESRAKLLYTMRLFKEAVEKAHHLIRDGLDQSRIEKLLYHTIPNSHYAHSAYLRAKLYRDQPHLKLSKPQLFSAGKQAEHGNRNIRLVDFSRVRIKIPHANGNHEWLDLDVKFGSRYLKLVRDLDGVSYGAGVCIKPRGYYLYLNIPALLYIQHFSKGSLNSNSHIAAFDDNPESIAMAILNWRGELLDSRIESFPEVARPGFSRNTARDLRLKALSKLIDYAAHHGVRWFVFEAKSNLPRSRSTRSGNRKLSRFAYSELIQHASTMIARWGGELRLMNPRYVSQAAGIISKDLGLDIHTASAYVLGLRFIKTHQ